MPDHNKLAVWDTLGMGPVERMWEDLWTRGGGPVDTWEDLWTRGGGRGGARGRVGGRTGPQAAQGLTDQEGTNCELV